MPLGTDKYETYEKYYPFKREDNYKSDYYTIDKDIYDRAIYLNKLYKIDLILGYLILLWLPALIVFGALDLWLWFLFAFIGLMLHLTAVGVFEVKLDNKYFDLWQKFSDTEEFVYQKEQEELYNKLKHKQKVYEETKELVEMYNILDNKKMSKETKIKRLMKYIDRKENIWNI